MGVYVDDMRAQVGRHIVCHMMADTAEELHRMAERIGLSPGWRHGDHYDVPLPQRVRAVAEGAIEVSQREMVRIRQRLRRAAGGGA
jgi:threonyl-tRNA synthetase